MSYVLPNFTQKATNQEHLHLCSLRTFDGINILGCCKSLTLSMIQNVLLHLSFVQNIGLRRNADGQVLSLFKSSKRATILKSILEKVILVLLSRKFQKKRMDKSVLMSFANQPASQKKSFRKTTPRRARILQLSLEEVISVLLPRKF